MKTVYVRTKTKDEARKRAEWLYMILRDCTPVIADLHTSKAQVVTESKVDVAYGFDKSLAGTYKVTASGLNLRAGAGTGKSILAVMENGEKVQCYGYYNDCNGVKWLYVVYKNIVGYASSKYLSK